MIHNFTAGTRANRATAELSQEDMRKRCASIFAETAAGDVSGRYTFIPTSSIVTALEPFGFVPVQCQEKRSMNPDYKGFNKHLVRFTHRDNLAADWRVGSERFDLVLTNSHNRTSGFSLMAGLYRLVCSNGLVVGGDLSGMRARHTGGADGIIDVAFQVIDSAPKVMKGVEVMKALPLSIGEQTAFAAAAREVLETENKPEPKALLAARRVDDRGDDLWRVFNRVQENVVQGGVRLPYDRERRAVRTRAVGSVDGNVKVNKALWTLAEEMAKLKGVSLN